MIVYKDTFQQTLQRDNELDASRGWWSDPSIPAFLARSLCN